MSNVEKPIMVRAEIDQDEWRALRRLAFDRQVKVQTLIGELVRKELEGAGATSIPSETPAPSGG